MPRALHPNLGTLLVAAWAFAGCGREPHHGGDVLATQPVLAPDAGARPPTSGAPATAGSVPPTGSALTAPPLDDLASVPEGACVRKVPSHGPPRVSAPDPGGSPLPLIKDWLAKQARGAVDTCFSRAPRLSGRLVM